VDWDLDENIPQSTWVTITTEFVLPSWNAMWYDDVHFTYPDAGAMFPYLAWNLQTPKIEKAESIPDVTGGYVIGSFDVYYISNPNEPVAHYRFVHQYSYSESPEFHTFLLTGSEEAFVTNLYFGHSYGYPTPEELWSFEDWITRETEQFTLSKEPLAITLDWKGLLPYPKGEDITGRISDFE
jgi:hypothetical protein